MYARREKDEPEFFYFLPAQPGIETSFKRWNVVVICLLALLVLGVFVAGWGSEVLHGSVVNGPSPVVHHHTAIVHG